MLGVLTAGRFASDSWPRFLTVGLHRNLSLLCWWFLALHVGTTVVDTYTSIPLIAAFIPFSSSYKTIWLSLGAVACDLLLALVVTSLVRNRLGHRTWRADPLDLPTPAGRSRSRTAWASAPTGARSGYSR